MNVKLFGARLSPFVEKTVRALQLKGIAFELVKLKSFGDFKRWNPTTGKMPVLDVDGERTYDSTFILRKLDELVAEPPLFSTDPTIAARQSFIEDWSDESLYWFCMAFRWAPENEKATVAQLAGMLPRLLRPLGGLIFPRMIGGTARAQGLARLPMSDLTDELGRRLDEIVSFLGDKPFLFSDTVSAADLAIYGQANTMRSGPTPQCVRLIETRPAFVDYLVRVEQATNPRGNVSSMRAA